MVAAGGPGDGNTTSSQDSSGAVLTPPAEGISPPSRREPEAETPLEVGTILGGFQVDKILGRGGMAVVYRAVQLSLNRPVAIKVLAARYSSNPRFVERFDREAGALAQITHPNIVNIIEKGSQDNLYYFVMELVEGITLDQLIHSVDLTHRHYTHVITEIGKALSYVHGMGIIHRDIKPANVLVTRHGMVKVSDFGIAHIAEGDAPAEDGRRVATLGTLHYMAPEQAMDPGKVDARADIYSLAVTFYKMFTRQLPTGNFPSPSALNPKLPMEVDAVMARGLQRKPENRYQDVREFCEDLLAAFHPGMIKKKKSSTDSGISMPSLFSGGTGGGDAGGERTDRISTSALFRPAFLYSDSDPEVSTPLPRPSPLAQGATPAAAEEAELEEDEQDPPFYARPLFWIGTGVILLGVAAGFVYAYLEGLFL